MNPDILIFFNFLDILSAFLSKTVIQANKTMNSNLYRTSKTVVHHPPFTSIYNMQLVTILIKIRATSRLRTIFNWENTEAIQSCYTLRSSRPDPPSHR